MNRNVGPDIVNRLIYLDNTNLIRITESVVDTFALIMLVRFRMDAC